jgi:hypothetical protein
LGPAGVCGEAENDYRAKDSIVEIAGVSADAAKGVAWAGGTGTAGGEGINAVGVGSEGSGGVASRRTRGKVALGKPMRERTVGLGWLAARREMRSAANVSQTFRKTEWKSLLKRLPRTLAEYVSQERS